MTVSLPDAGDGSRRRRRDETKKRRRPSWRVVVAAFGAVALVAVGAWVVIGLLDDDGDAVVADEPSTTPVPAANAATGEGPGLLVITDDAGEVVGITVFQPATGAIVHVPPGTLVEVASMGLVPLRDAAASGGDVLLRDSLENLLGVRFAEAATLTTDELAALADGVTVAVDEPVEAPDASGRVTEVVPAGDVEVDPETLGPLLGAVGDGTALDRIVRHQAFWTAYLAAGADGPVEAIGGLDPDALQWVLPVEAVAGLEGADELYRVIDDDVVELVGRLFPDAPGGDADRFRVRILNGAGVPGVAQDVQPLLLDAGGVMTLSGNADRFDYDTTQIVYYDDEDRAAAEAIHEAIGVGEVVKSLTELDVVDVTVVVGTDFLANQPEG
jgi:hypothetical protein